MPRSAPPPARWHAERLRRQGRALQRAVAAREAETGRRGRHASGEASLLFREIAEEQAFEERMREERRRRDAEWSRGRNPWQD